MHAFHRRHLPLLELRVIASFQFSPMMARSPQTSEFPHMAELPHIAEFPHMAELPHRVEFPHMAESPVRKILLPHTSEELQTADCPHGVLLSARRKTLPLFAS